ncbi:threonine/serine exporter family protein [Salirhabdus sp. Marseille-P4669]|uniref:threonine/serine exporter family protein n=1 Tax=Salirhabdus sp. Marseille-P4669 TaxID=2042310 RepID=UPI000C7D1EE7|nr:threonine/serine exporter family protein [Salirhabdus sp. Marseille-P4669]
MERNESKTYDVIDVCLLAGKIMLMCGAETYRVEDTMMRMAAAYGMEHSHSFVMPTGIIFSIDGKDPTKLVRVTERSTDLSKVTKVNSISRQITAGSISVQEAYQQLKAVDEKKEMYAGWIQTTAAAISSGCFLIMFQGQWQDFFSAVLAGGFGFICFLYMSKLLQLKFFAEFSAAFVIGIISLLLVYVGLGNQIDKIIIGSVMPLVPGLLITNAVRDLLAGHLISCLSKGAEAFLTAFAIGAGIALAIGFAI